MTMRPQVHSSGQTQVVRLRTCQLSHDTDRLPAHHAKTSSARPAQKYFSTGWPAYFCTDYITQSDKQTKAYDMGILYKTHGICIKVAQCGHTTICVLHAPVTEITTTDVHIRGHYHTASTWLASRTRNPLQSLLSKWAGPAGPKNRILSLLLKIRWSIFYACRTKHKDGFVDWGDQC